MNQYEELLKNALLQQQSQNAQTQIPVNNQQTNPAMQLQELQKQQMLMEYFKTERGLKLNAALEKDFEDWRSEKLGIQKPIDYSNQLSEQSKQIEELKMLVQDLIKNKNV